MQCSALKTLITLGFALMASVYTGNIFAAEPQQNKNERKAASIDELLVGLRKRLETEPNDVNGWVLLAKSYHHLDMLHEAEAAAAKARELGFKGEIVPVKKAVNPHVNNPHHSFVDPNAGSYVSSFFKEQEKGTPSTSTTQNTAQPATQEQ